jgi:hypothetical protein
LVQVQGWVKAQKGWRPGEEMIGVDGSDFAKLGNVIIDVLRRCNCCR